MDVKDRIKIIMQDRNLSQQDFANVLGITPGSLSGILNERTRPTNNHTIAIHRAFPDISIDWLLFGEGAMYKSESAASANGVLPLEEGESHPMSSAPSVAASNVQGTAAQMSTSFVMPAPVVQRQVKEIRVFYDDGTYESFVPQ